MHRSALVLCALSSLLHLLPALPASRPKREAASSTARPEDEEQLFHHFLSGSLEMEMEVGVGEALEDGSNKRLGRRETMVELRHLHCSKAAGETWSAAGGGGAALFSESVLYRVTVTTASTEPPWKVFPLWHLMVFMRRFYSCCKFGYPCRTIKGYQGRLLGHDDREMEFFLRPEYLFVNILRAQLHLNIANPDRVVLEAEIRVKMQGTTVITRARNIVWHTRSESELAFDALFLFKLMKEAHLQAGGGTTQFQLILRCSRHNRPLSCRDHGVAVLRAPFMAIGYI